MSLELSPLNAVNVVGSDHTVTARLGASAGVIAAAHVHFDVSGANSTSGDTTTNASGEATFTYTGTNAGTDTIRACFDANDDHQCGTDELVVSVTKRFITAGTGQAGVSLAVAPLTAVNPVGTEHTVAASLSGGVLSDQSIHFAVTGANATSGDATTDASGHASFTYTGTNAGEDTIVVCLDANANKACDDDELAVSVVKRFVATSATQTGGGGGGGQIGAGTGAGAGGASGGQVQSQSPSGTQSQTTKRKHRKRAHHRKRKHHRKRHHSSARRPHRVGGFTG